MNRNRPNPEFPISTPPLRKRLRQPPSLVKLNSPWPWLSGKRGSFSSSPDCLGLFPASNRPRHRHFSSRDDLCARGSLSLLVRYLFGSGDVAIILSKRQSPKPKPPFARTSRTYRSGQSGTIIRTAQGERLCGPRYWFERAKRDAKIEGLHWHDLRHTFGSRLAMAGVNLRAVQEALGHKRIAMTVRYSHLSPEYQPDAVERLVPKPRESQSAGANQHHYRR